MWLNQKLCQQHRHLSDLWIRNVYLMPWTCKCWYYCFSFINLYKCHVKHNQLIDVVPVSCCFLLSCFEVHTIKIDTVQRVSSGTKCLVVWIANSFEWKKKIRNQHELEVSQGWRRKVSFEIINIPASIFKTFAHKSIKIKWLDFNVGIKFGRFMPHSAIASTQNDIFFILLLIW